MKTEDGEKIKVGDVLYVTEGVFGRTFNGIVATCMNKWHISRKVIVLDGFKETINANKMKSLRKKAGWKFNKKESVINNGK